MVELRDAVLASCLSIALVGCAGEPPPLSKSAPLVPVASPGSAKVVFLWAPDSCEQGGHFTIAETSGRFVGTVSRGTRLEVNVPAGPRTFMMWNQARETISGAADAASVGVMRAEFVEDRTYFVRVAFGVWDEHGPRVVYSRGRRVCLTSVALLRLSPPMTEWSDLHDWLEDLTPVAPDQVAGQAWLDHDPDTTAVHRDIAERRMRRLRPSAVSLATMLPSDGVRIVP